MFDYKQRPATDAYRDNWERIFGKQERIVDAVPERSVRESSDATSLQLPVSLPESSVASRS